MKARQAGSTKNADWVIVAQFLNEADADMAVALLKGSRIPAARLPITPLTMSTFGTSQPVRVLVPPDRAEEARELLGE